MTTPEARTKIEEAGKYWPDFINWMVGQTIGGTAENPDWYDDDVERFIRGASSWRY